MISLLLKTDLRIGSEFQAQNVTWTVEEIQIITYETSRKCDTRIFAYREIQEDEMDYAMFTIGKDSELVFVG